MTSADVVPPVMSIREGLEPARRLTYVAPSGTMLMNAQPHPKMALSTKQSGPHLYA